MRTRSRTAREIEQAADRPPEKERKEVPVFSTGSTLLNLACSDDEKAAFPTGVLVNIIGDSHAGKTVLAHSIMAEVVKNPTFDNYTIYYDRGEASLTEGIEGMFGSKLEKRKKEPINGSSLNIHDFKTNIWKLFDSEKPFMYILDSLDALTTPEAEKRLDDAADGKKEKGSYGMEKPKVLSNILGPITQKLKKTESILIILSQTRDDINPFSFQEKTRSGGRALKFYSAFEMWLAVAKSIRKKVGNFDRIIGHTTKIKITKNKLTGKVRDVELDILQGIGLDNIGKNIDFLVAAQVFTESGRTIAAEEFNLKGTKEKLISLIEEQNLENKLEELVGKTWKPLEKSFEVSRKKRYE